jgi:hypothetical protein
VVVGCVADVAATVERLEGRTARLGELQPVANHASGQERAVIGDEPSPGLIHPLPEAGDGRPLT